MTTTTHGFDEKRVLQIEGVGFFAEAASGAAVFVCSLLGLAGVLPGVMAAMAAIALGVGLTVEGGTVASQYRKLLSMLRAPQGDPTDLGSGVSIELIAGLLTVTMGILALLQVGAPSLMPVSVIVASSAMLVTSLAVSRFNDIAIDSIGLSDKARRVTHSAVSAAAGVQCFVGVATMVIGVVSLAVPSAIMQTFTLIALLTIGISEALSGSALAARLKAFRN
jgi:hypothetical protein